MSDDHPTAQADVEWIAWLDVLDPGVIRPDGPRHRVYVRGDDVWTLTQHKGGAARYTTEAAALAIAEMKAHEFTPHGAEAVPIRARLRPRPGDMPGR